MAIDDYAPPQFVAAGETEEEKEANLESVLPSPGFPAFTELMVEAIEKRSEITVLDFSPNQVNIRYKIDGIWHAMAPMDRETGDYMLASLKQIAGLEYRDRRSRQEGNFRTDYLKRKTKCRVVTQGIKTGERVALYVDIPKPTLDTVEQLGMRERMKDDLTAQLADSGNGLTLYCALPGQGYTTGWRAVLNACDRFTRDYYVIEEASRQEPEVINVGSITYDESKGEDAFTPMPQLLLKEPNFIAFSEIKDAAMLDQICDLSKQQDLPTLTRLHGKNALDGLLRLLLIKSDRQKLVEQLEAVVAMRVIRKLCEECRVAFRPNPMLLQKLGIPPGRIQNLYNPFPWKPEMVDENGKEILPCEHCHGIGYIERTGIFEMLKVTNPIRQVLLQNPNINQLTAEVRKHGHVTFRDEGVLLVAKGVTSVEELQRVLKA